VYGGGVAAAMDDFRVLEIIGPKGRTREKSMNQDKGQSKQLAETIDAFRRRGEAPIPFQQLMDVMQVVFAARASLASGNAVSLETHAIPAEAPI
jgi:hypothetical protein